MRRISLVLAAIMVVTLVLAACGGKKDAAAVVKELDQVVGKLDSYQGTGRMTLHTGQQPQEYAVEVWYQQPSFYRIKLTNEKQDITQIVLRNNDGVFVLTPHLNKSFRFQSNWPENQGQVYLYQSLADSILADKERQFTEDNGAYVFDVAANYQNSALVRQKIWLDQKNLAPKQVKVSDANANVLVEVEFSNFEFSKKFDSDSFDMQRNMTSMTLPGTMPTAKQETQGAAKAGDSQTAAGTGGGAADAGKSAAGSHDTAATGKSGSASSTAAGASQTAAPGATDKGGTATGTSTGTTVTQSTTGTAAQGTAQGTTPAAGAGAADKGTVTGTAAGASGTAAGTGSGTAAANGQQQAAEAKELDFGIITPTHTPAGVKQQQISQITVGQEKALLLRYSGKYNYTLMELKPEARETYLVPGDIVDLGYTIAVLSGEQKKTLIWTHDGVEYRLSSADLPDDEMFKIAQSVQGQLGK
ncbi:DUF4367 domain-containing protein [Paenibacillus chartarius]|uniref:DUF4367 domain-containing protein n=1 Tax=Paenibacillus chartarius TaxID=747481 RepID=A0ABV6DKS9_9BACL